jgi:hypothetical protein
MEEKVQKGQRAKSFWPNFPQIILHCPNFPKSMDFPMEFPTNLTWEIVVNCSCSFPDYNCWRPAIYAKPIECVPASMDLNQLFNGLHNNKGNGGGNLLPIIGIILQVKTIVFSQSIIFHPQILAFGFAIYSFMALSRSRRQELRSRSRRQELRNENVVEEGGKKNKEAKKWTRKLQAITTPMCLLIFACLRIPIRP